MTLLKATRTILLTVFLASTTTPAAAQMVVNPSTLSSAKKTQVGASFATSTTDYELRSSREIKRKILSADFSTGVSPDLAVIGQVGMTFDGEWEALDDVEGDGYIVGAGLSSELYSSSSMSFKGFGMLTYISEEFKGDVSSQGYDVDTTIDLDVTELHLGGVATYKASPKVQPYAGLELIPYSDGDAKVKAKLGGYSASESEDIERDDSLNIRLGANFVLNSLTLSPQIVIASEETFLLSGMTSF